MTPPTDAGGDATPTSDAGPDASTTDAGEVVDDAAPPLSNCEVLSDPPMTNLPEEYTLQGTEPGVPGEVVLTSGDHANSVGGMWFKPIVRGLKRLVIEVDYEVRGVSGGQFGKGITVAWLDAKAAPGDQKPSDLYGVCSFVGAAVVADVEDNSLSAVSVPDCKRYETKASDLRDKRQLRVEIWNDRIVGIVKPPTAAVATLTQQTMQTPVAGRFVITGTTTEQKARQSVTRVRISRCD